MENEAEGKNHKERDPDEIFNRIKSMVPAAAGYVKSEFEGPDIVIYLKNPKALYEDDSIIRGIASSIKKKLIIRAEQGSLMPKAKAEEIIRSLVPNDAVIASIKFVEDFSEVYIEALKPGLVIGKSGSTLKSIAMQTNWTPRVLRTPTMESDTLSRVRQLMFNEADFRKKFLVGVGKHINRVITKSEWLKATALGGYREVGRSSLLLETPHSKKSLKD